MKMTAAAQPDRPDPDWIKIRDIAVDMLAQGFSLMDIKVMLMRQTGLPGAKIAKVLVAARKRIVWI